MSDEALKPEAEDVSPCLEQGGQPEVIKVHQRHNFWINIYFDDRKKLCGVLRETRKKEK